MKISIFFSMLQVCILHKIRIVVMENAKSDNDVVSAVTKFCLGKERENFCSDQHLHMMINFAALQGKSRPIQDMKELEEERQKELEKQRIQKIEQEKKKLKLLELRKERDRQLELNLKKKLEEEQQKKIEREEKILKHIMKSLNEKNGVRFYFRF